MFIKVISIIPKIILFIAISGLFLLFFLRLITFAFAQTKKSTIMDIKSAPVAVVFGAGLWRDGSPTPVLRDRVETAVELYNSGKVLRILMSGDNIFENYNEPAAMRDYALSLGIPEDVVILDPSGHRTYDTCYRAKHIFGLERVILVTQGFHLPRALYTCNVLGLNATGVAADMRTYRTRSLLFWQVRESFATLVAFWEVHITRPLPILGEPEYIFTINNKSKQEG